MEFSDIQEHVSYGRYLICEADAVLLCIPCCSSALVLVFSCLHCTMTTATSDRVPFLNPDDQWSMILALESFVFFWLRQQGVNTSYLPVQDSADGFVVLSIALSLA